MKISLNWLSEYLDVAPIRADLKGVLGQLTMRGLEVEAVQDLSKGFDKVIVAHLEVRDKHPNSDRLSLCKVNTGKETLQIVCGAQNMKSGDKVALSMIGALLPNGLKIEKGRIRDVDSYGMLCSEVELGLAEQSDGIMILPADAPVGQPLAPFLGRDDILIEINVTPNRGDALSHLGVARELASILGQRLKQPPHEVAEAGGDSASKIKVTLQAGDACLQYHGRYIDGVKIQASPEWLKKRLTAIGLRPINNVVDVTNFVLMEYGQPLHAFDYAQVKGGHIQVRKAKSGEKLPLLDDTTIELNEDDLVIADNERAVALAGVMGGGNSEVTEKTTSILLEAAQFLPASVRRTARRHQKNSDSSYRFERQVDARAVRAAMDRAAALIVQVAGGKAYKGTVSQYSPAGERLAKGESRSVKVSVAVANRVLGTALTDKQIQDCLLQAGFGVEKAGGEALLVKIPSYRPEVELVEDLYEEILRIWGYDKIEAKVPRMDFIPEQAGVADQRSKLLEKLKLALAELGFSESVNFAFTSKATNERWGGAEASKAVELANPLNEEFTTLKTSLMTGLIENLVTAVRYQESDVRLFEIRPTFFRDDKSDTGVREEWRIGLLMCGRAYSQALAARDRELDFFDAKGVLEAALETLGCRGLRYGAPQTQDSRLHPAQTATLLLGRGPAGVIGRLHPKTQSEMKLRQPVYLIELSWDRVLEVVKSERKYAPVPRFPVVTRDLSLLVPEAMPAEKVLQAIQKHGKPLVDTVAVVDTYVGDKIPAGTMSLSVSYILGDASRTLADTEVDSTTQKILSGLDKDLGVKLRLQ